MSFRLVLTRPEISSRRVLSACEAAIGAPISAEISPVMRIEVSETWPDLNGYRAVLLTSAHAVFGPLDGMRAYCVGPRTAAAATDAGAEVVVTAPDAAHLPADIAERPLIYLRGEHVSADLAAHYNCAEIIVYDQHPTALTKAAMRALTGEKPAILPLFSPRSARLIAKEVVQLGQKVHIIAMSAAVAKAWDLVYCGQMPDQSVEICEEPTQIAMVGRIVASLHRLSGGMTG